MIINFIISECINNSVRFRMKSHIQLQSCVDTIVFINALDGRHDKSSFGTSPRNHIKIRVRREISNFKLTYLGNNF